MQSGCTSGTSAGPARAAWNQASVDERESGAKALSQALSADPTLLKAR
jgi:hypothetical protein